MYLFLLGKLFMNVTNPSMASNKATKFVSPIFGEFNTAVVLEKFVRLSIKTSKHTISMKMGSSTAVFSAKPSACENIP